jgi:hypothetical protein
MLSVIDDIPFLNISLSTGVEGQKKLRQKNKYIDNFNSDFTFVIFATNKNKHNFGSIVEYANYIFNKIMTTKSYQLWVIPPQVKLKEPITECDLKNLNNFYGGNLIMKLFCCELNTNFDLNCNKHNKLIHKLFPYDEKFSAPYKLFQCVFDCNYRSYILETNNYYYLIGNAFS